MHNAQVKGEPMFTSRLLLNLRDRPFDNWGAEKIWSANAIFFYKAQNQIFFPMYQKQTFFYNNLKTNIIFHMNVNVILK